jgi:hypothetical protein
MLRNNNIKNWEEFYKALCVRFDNCNDVVDKFNKLEHEKGMEEYTNRLKS